jgi:hypothetical protein
VVFVLPSRPASVREDGGVTVNGPGFRAEFSGAAAEEVEGGLLIRLKQ